MSAPVRIAVFASGSGTNAEQLMRHFNGGPIGDVVLLGCDRPGAGALRRAWELGVPGFLFNGEALSDGTVLKELKEQRVDLLVLAGFLRLLPRELVHHYEGRALNIHPSLLPKYGGRGMYGERVHEAVIAAGEKESGITVHLVNERFDEGAVLFQAKCPVLEDDSATSLAARIHALEHAHFPLVVEQQCQRMLSA